MEKGVRDADAGEPEEVSVFSEAEVAGECVGDPGDGCAVIGAGVVFGDSFTAGFLELLESELECFGWWCGCGCG